jgi:hypothetical protein
MLISAHFLEEKSAICLVLKRCVLSLAENAVKYLLTLVSV